MNGNRRWNMPPPKDISVTMNNGCVADDIALGQIVKGAIIFRKMNALSGETNLYSPLMVNMKMAEYHRKLFGNGVNEGVFHRWIKDAWERNLIGIVDWLLYVINNGNTGYYVYSDKNTKMHGSMMTFMRFKTNPDVFFPNDMFFNPKDFELLCCMNTTVFNIYYRLEGTLFADEFLKTKGIYTVATCSEDRILNYWAKDIKRMGTEIHPSTRLYALFKRTEGENSPKSTPLHLEFTDGNDSNNILKFTVNFNRPLILEFEVSPNATVPFLMPCGFERQISNLKNKNIKMIFNDEIIYINGETENVKWNGGISLLFGSQRVIQSPNPYLIAEYVSQAESSYSQPDIISEGDISVVNQNLMRSSNYIIAILRVH